MILFIVLPIFVISFILFVCVFVCCLSSYISSLFDSYVHFLLPAFFYSLFCPSSLIPPPFYLFIPLTIPPSYHPSLPPSLLPAFPSSLALTFPPSLLPFGCSSLPNSYPSIHLLPPLTPPSLPLTLLLSYSCVAQRTHLPQAI